MILENKPKIRFVAKRDYNLVGKRFIIYSKDGSILDSGTLDEDNCSELNMDFDKKGNYRVEFLD